MNKEKGYRHKRASERLCVNDEAAAERAREGEREKGRDMRREILGELLRVCK